MSRNSLAPARARALRSGGTLAVAPDPCGPPPARPSGRSAEWQSGPPDPEDDDSDRGTPRLGPALVVGVLAWGVLMWLLL